MFLRNNTNKQYSLRKLKKGTASVAVALAVLGAGVATSQTVKADEDVTLARRREEGRNRELYDSVFLLHSEVQNLVNYMRDLQVLKSQSYSTNSEQQYVDYLKRLNDQFEKIYNEKTGIKEKRILKDKITALSNDFAKQKIAREKLIRNFAKIKAEMSSEISDKNKEMEFLRQLYGQEIGRASCRERV